MTAGQVVLGSLSAAMDGGFTAIADVSQAMSAAGAQDDYRLIGGVTVMLHIERLGLDVSLRATADADFGVPPHVLRRPDLVEAIERLGYRKVFGNRWERRLDDRRVAAVDLLVPAYRSRHRHGRGRRHDRGTRPGRGAPPARRAHRRQAAPHRRNAAAGRPSSYPTRSAPWR